MNSHSFSSSLPILVFSLLFLFPGFPVSHSNPYLYEACRDAVFECGNISIGYPFSGGNRRGECGHRGLELRCEDGTNTTIIEIHDVKYKVMDIRPESQTLRIGRDDFINGDICRRPQTPTQDSIIDSELFHLVPGYTNVTLFYDCPRRSPWFIPCDYSYYHNVSVTTDDIRGDGDGCSANVTFPISRERLHDYYPDLLRSLTEALKSGFEVKWKEDTQACRNCTASRGACGFNWYINQATCFCPYGTENSRKNPYECQGGNNHRHGVQVGLGLGIAAAAAILVCAFVLWFKRNSLSNHFYSGKMKENAMIEEFITNFGSFTPKRYSYGEIKKMTNKFSYKLGQGGFGSVYKGKLSDGRFVAVKILSESKGNGEDFMNEVASISRTSHVNVVSFLGFCFERSKRALIYEFMSHGSLDKFIYGQGSDNQSRRLEWQVLYNIALGIARGLEYLHQGCNTRILHFDIKPHNILLDEDFCPKISDFGLSKLCKTNESAVSMACARGTIGYIAPEVFCRNFGRVSYKSDVYSYGMLILEMVGGRRNIDVEVCKTSEVYFPTWIHKHLDQSMCLNLDGVIAEKEEEITRKLTIVSLWCIQNSPSDRPSMAKVIEMLQGSLQSLVIPPRPFVSSPVRSPGTYIETSSMI